jgi:hypothetical protein
VTSYYQTVALADSPTLLWPLNETTGTTAADVSGNSNNGTYTGGYTLADAAGPVLNGGSAVLLNGSSGYIASSVNPHPAAITLECWVNFNGLSQSGDSRIMANDHPAGTHNGFEFFWSPTNHSVAIGAIFGDGSNGHDAFSGVDADATGWDYLVATWDGSTINVYKNAVNIKSAAASGTLTAGADNFAAGYDPQYGGDYLHGLMAWVGIYPSALSSARITAHYNAASQTFPIGGNQLQAGRTMLRKRLLYADL